MCGVSEATVRKWVQRGHLVPVRPGAKPLRFRPEHVVEAVMARRSRSLQARLDTLGERLLAFGAIMCHDAARDTCVPRPGGDR